ncbi:MAG: YggS family pyridoxal phosphate-dependent enzyme [Bacillota bacterium]
MTRHLSANLAEIRERVKEAACRVGKKPEDIEIVAVSKNVDVGIMQQAQALGINSFGENRVQEFVQKYPSFNDSICWHFIGHLQTNKAKPLIDKVDLIHSLDRLSLAKELQQRAAEKGLLVKVLLQVNISRENTKFGLEEKEVLPFLEALIPMNNLQVMGLMTMAPISDQPEEVRPVFAGLRKMAEKISREGFPLVEMRYLSMGMSQDYQVAIEEGANIVRIGSGIFGARKG